MKALLLVCLVYVEARIPGALAIEVFELPASDAQDFAKEAWTSFSNVTNVTVSCDP